MENIYTRNFTIRTYEVDAKARVKLSTIFNFLQEVASDHAALLGASVVDLFARNLTWVLSRYHIKIERYPVWGQKIKINTWPSMREKYFSLREFQMLDEKETPFVLGTSSWILLDLKSKRPVLPAEFLPKFPHNPKRMIEDRFEPLPEISKAEIELPFRARMHDLDLNNHVNHVTFIEWGIESVPHEILRKYRLAEIEAGFRGEAFYGEQVLSRTEKAEDGEAPVFVHQIVREKDGRELTRLRTKWEVLKKV